MSKKPLKLYRRDGRPFQPYPHETPQHLIEHVLSLMEKGNPEYLACEKTRGISQSSFRRAMERWPAVRERRDAAKEIARAKKREKRERLGAKAISAALKAVEIEAAAKVPDIDIALKGAQVYKATSDKADVQVELGVRVDVEAEAKRAFDSLFGEAEVVEVEAEPRLNDDFELDLSGEGK